ncbi:endonuclease III domain-containing protein [Paracraurococcus lichenis]|uniref:Fe-S cluster assembly protein HesB n=1 Tax=Paracraurococcus lichenis TaxID=3064888 RepID=A0ABT9E5U2_9PROT|nr:Fe-S cluster assembly protein HesB [Paracraurococcus sp. LOR1-02]MDO9711550.1 Fe-S cluster assembly protein HesB [Paracraurococcus sp. LOR1-02]
MPLDADSLPLQAPRRTARLPPAPDAAKRALALEAHARLCAEYDCPIAYFHALPPLDELVSSLLSHRTKNRDSARAFQALRAAFPDWAAVRDAPVAAVEQAIAGVTWPEAKAPALQRTLRAITGQRGTLDLSHLEAMPEAEAAAWLAVLPGVGPKTAAAVLSFSTLRGRALPVDSHHHRVAQRLGLIPRGLAVGPSHAVLAALLPAEWDAQQVYDHHQVLMRHGQRCCFFRNPACGRCVLRDLCPEGQARLAGSA